MNPLRDDSGWHDAFERLREQDRRFAPSFADTCAGAGRRRTAAHRPARILRPAWGLAVAALLAAGWWMLPSIRNPDPAHPATSPASTAPLSQWRSPTAFLMSTPDHALLREVPRVGAPDVVPTLPDIEDS